MKLQTSVEAVLSVFGRVPKTDRGIKLYRGKVIVRPFPGSHKKGSLLVEGKHPKMRALLYWGPVIHG